MMPMRTALSILMGSVLLSMSGALADTTEAPMVRGKLPHLSISPGMTNVVHFLGESGQIPFSIMNLNSDATYTLRHLPQREHGIWQHGEIVFEGGNIEPLENSRSSTEETEFPVEIGPRRIHSGSIPFDDHVEITDGGQFTYSIVMELETADGRIIEIESGVKNHRVFAPPHLDRGEVGHAMRAVVSALENWKNWNGGYPPSRPNVLPHSPLFPTALTTPIAYLSPEDAEAADGLTVLTDQLTYIVAAQGPDGDWDIAPMLQSNDIFGYEDYSDWIYDPTNGLESTGDLVIDLPAMWRAGGAHSRLDPINWSRFEIQGVLTESR